jgi:hypothetical protein
MSTLEDIVRMKKNGMKVQAFKRIRIRRLDPSTSIWDVEAKVQEMAEQEEAMSRYEHNLEVG